MASTVTDRTHVRSGAGWAQALALWGGALLLVLALGFGLLSLADSVGRYGLGRPLLGGELVDSIVSYFGLGFAGAALLALPAALAAPFVSTGDPPLRSHSALALVPGCLIALAAGVGGIVAIAIINRNGELGLTIAYLQVSAIVDSYSALVLPLVVALSAAIGGGRTPEATAAVAAPAIICGFYGLLAEVSIGQVLAATLVPGIVAAAATAILYAFAPARAVTPWLAGWALALGMTLFVATGLFTPTETAGLFVIFGLLIAVPVRVLALGQPIAPILRQAGMETAAILSCLAAAMLVGTALIYAQVPDAVATAARGGVSVVAAMAVIFLALSYLLTPVLALALVLPLTLVAVKQAGIDPVFAGVVLVLLGLAAAVTRAARPASAEPAVSLRPAAAWVLAAILVGLGIAVTLEPRIAMTLGKAL